MAITIKDIAKIAGVSPSTVSKVINDSPTIPFSTKVRIQAIMKEQNYYPNQIAKNFAQQSSYTLGVVIPIKKTFAFTNPYIYEILGGIEQIATENGYLLTLINADSVVESRNSLEKLVQEKRVDGLIIDVSVINGNIIKRLNSLKFPYIVLGKPENDKEVCWIDMNNILAGEIATKRLIEQGYKKVAFIGDGSVSNTISHNRLEGYKSILNQYKLPIEEDYIEFGNANNNDGYTITQKLLKLKNPPDSLVCTSCFMAFGIIKAVKENGLKIPDDIGIISFDRYPLSEYMDPMLSVVDIDVFEMGVHTATTLINKIKNPNLQIQYTMLSPSLIANKSTK
ncbi:MAG: LacI family transcriptional regulator [Clostridiaceae bacterium]|jgi:DNA-binding LacI/PurR family transcriptional regulator|nr:LacI family transcriptional regulator [Clostridiaceae bacterium]